MMGIDEKLCLIALVKKGEKRNVVFLNHFKVK